MCKAASRVFVHVANWYQETKTCTWRDGWWKKIGGWSEAASSLMASALHHFPVWHKTVFLSQVRTACPWQQWARPSHYWWHALFPKLSVSSLPHSPHTPHAHHLNAHETNVFQTSCARKTGSTSGQSFPPAEQTGKTLRKCWHARWDRGHSQKFLTSSWLCVAKPGRVREPTADRGRWSPQRCAGIQCNGRSWRKKKRSVLSQELSSARKPFLYIYFPSFPIHPSLGDLSFCLFVEAISLTPRRPPGVTHPALTHSVTLSSQARSSPQFHSFWKGSRKEGPFSYPRTNCSLYESIISCAHWKPTPSTRPSAGPPPTPRSKQTFLKISALCREKHRLWRKQRATVRRPARPRRKQTRQSWKET